MIRKIVLACVPALALTLGSAGAFAQTSNSMSGPATSKPATTSSTMAPAHTAMKAKGTKLAHSFKTESEATSACAGDTVVWANTSGSKVFHTSGSKYYGKTKHGAYTCSKDATAAGYHASKT